MQTNGDGGPTVTTRRNNLKENVFKALAAPLIQQSLILLDGTNTLLRLFLRATKGFSDLDFTVAALLPTQAAELILPPVAPG